MPYLQKLHEQHQANGLRVMMIAIDMDEAGQKKVSDLIAENKVTFPVANISAVHRGYSTDGAELLGQEVETALGIKK